jgi:hypothetical protein
MWDFDPGMHAYATGPDLDRLIARPHGAPAGLRTKRCKVLACELLVARPPSEKY